MSATGSARGANPERSMVLRRRVRRAAALAGMLTAVGGLVGVRAALTPAPTQALSSSGLAAETGGSSSNHAQTPKQRPAGGSAHAPRVVLGRSYDVSYGVVQVKVTLVGTRIADLSAVSLPRGGHSGDISQSAAPQLRQEALKAQSAHIDTVSGASYTSAGYAMSLQSALDEAGL